MAQICVFDAYGTLFDVHSAVARHAHAVGPDAQRVSEIWRNKQLEYSWVRTAMGRYRDFWRLTEEALDFALAAVPGANASAREDLLDAYRTLDCFPEVPQVLAALRDRGVRLAILSNGSPEMLQNAVESARIGQYFDAVLSVDAAAIFKTAPATYRLVTDHFGAGTDEVAFHSSNRWDIAGASGFGFFCRWINRIGHPDEYADLPPAETLRDLRPLLES